MRVGCIVRGDRRGLAYQSGEFYRHMHPDVTVAVDISELPAKGEWPQDFTQYPDAVVTKWSPPTGVGFSDEALEALLSCDVIYSAETMYDDRLVPLATERKIPTVRHINCELYWNEGESHPIFPTDWRLPDIPEGPTVPVPVPDDRIGEPAGEGKVLHTAGWAAAHDRNGTKLVQPAIRHAPGVGWKVTSQYGRAVPNDPNVEMVGELDDRWDLYDGCSLLVLPRRYGGLCLPAQEAAARGLGLVMTDIPPQSDWPIIPLDITKRFHPRRRRVKPIEIVYCSPKQIAEVVSTITADGLREAQEAALTWAEGLKWSAWEDAYRRLFAQAIEEMR